MDTKCDVVFNIILVGNANVGKSCLLLRYTNDVYNDSSTTTIGLDFRLKRIKINNILIEVRVWDTAGLERFRSITESYYNGADAILLCYDVSNINAIASLKDDWRSISGINTNNRQQKIIKMLVATKTDIKERAITSEDGKYHASLHNYLYAETSAKNNVGVDDVFTRIITELLVSRNIATTEKLLIERSCRTCRININDNDLDDEKTTNNKCC